MRAPGPAAGWRPPSNANVTALCRKLWVVSLSLSSPAARRASFAICRMLRVDSGFPYVLLERLANSGASSPTTSRPSHLRAAR